MIKLLNILSEYKLIKNTNYDLVQRVAVGLADHMGDEFPDLYDDFEKAFEKGQNINKEEYFNFFNKYITFREDRDHVNNGWEWIESMENKNRPYEEEELDEYKLKTGSNYDAVFMTLITMVNQGTNESILSDFKQQFPKGYNLSEEEFYNFIKSWQIENAADPGDISYVNDRQLKIMWKWIEEVEKDNNKQIDIDSEGWPYIRQD
jgi:hypothetical protein